MTNSAPAASTVAAEAEEAPTVQVVAHGRDWVDWYEELTPQERREIRARLLTMTPEEVKADPDVRNFFLFHVDDLVDEGPPGTRRLTELHSIVMTLRGRDDPALVEQRRKAVAFLLAEYQGYLRDNPFVI